MNSRVVIVVFAMVAIASLVSGQEKEADKTDLELLKKELVQLRAQLDSLKALHQVLSDDQGDALDQLSARLDKRLTQLENKIDAISRATASTVLNPRTTAFINFAARVDDKKVMDESGQSEIGNRAFLRTFEMEIQAPVDPYAQAVTVMSLEDQAGKGFSIDAEEAYGLIKRLPILESAPLGLKLKLGKFRAPLGTDNKIHMHDLPWTTRPLVISKFLGTEHGEFFESGFNPVGLDFDFFLPNPIPTTTLEMNADVVRAGDLGLSSGHGGSQPAYIAHVTLSKDWNNEHLLVVGASGYSESGESATSLFGVDFTYKWAPAERREYHSFVMGGELFSGHHSFTNQNTATSISPYGWFAYSQYQFSYWTYAGIRYDWVQEPTDDRLITTAWSAYLSYYTTEFLRFRLGFQHKNSDILVGDQRKVNSVVLDVNLVFGSHPTEPYWVNR